MRLNTRKTALAALIGASLFSYPTFSFAQEETEQEEK